MTRKWTAHWMYATDRWAHWEIRSYGQPLGVCVIDNALREVSWHRYDGVPASVAFPNMAFRPALIWIERNQGESFPSRRT